MNISINLNLDNSAFEDNPDELRQTLNQIPQSLQPGDDGILRDSNGNRVGSYEVHENF